MSVSPGNYDITIYQGTTYTQQFTWKNETGSPVNLTGWTARMMARTTVEAVSPFITLTTANGGITLGVAAGTITLFMSDTATSALTQQNGVYDLELISGSGAVTRLLQGALNVSKEVTR